MGSRWLLQKLFFQPLADRPDFSTLGGRKETTREKRKNLLVMIRSLA